MLDAGSCEPVDVLQPSGQRVAAALELLEAEQSRAELRRAVYSARRIDADVREERGDRSRQFTLQARDLRAQRAARGTLVDLLDGLNALLGDQLLDLAHASDSS